MTAPPKMASSAIELVMLVQEPGVAQQTSSIASTRGSSCMKLPHACWPAATRSNPHATSIFGRLVISFGLVYTVYC
jgi:hypothetical protein